MFLLDTNTLIYLFKGKGQVLENIRVVPPAHIRIPIMVLYELQVGIAKSASSERRTRQLEQFVKEVAIAEFDQKAAVSAARIRADLESQGKPIGPIDVLIAGTAVSLEATLVTHNTEEFSRVPSLKLVDWF